MSATTQTGLDLILAAAKEHGENSEPEHEVGDLQVALRAAWQLMTPGQRAALLRSADVAEQLKNDLPDSDDGRSAAELIDTAVYEELEAAANGVTLYDLLVAQFPGLIEDDEVNGGDLVGWVSENLDLFQASAVTTAVDSYIEVSVTMRSKTTGGEHTETLRVWNGNSAYQVASENASGWGATVVSIANLDGTPFKGDGVCKQCDSPLHGDYCSDQTCSFHDWPQAIERDDLTPVSYTHLRAHET